MSDFDNFRLEFFRQIKSLCTGQPLSIIRFSSTAGGFENGFYYLFLFLHLFVSMRLCWLCTTRHIAFNRIKKSDHFAVNINLTGNVIPIIGITAKKRQGEGLEPVKVLLFHVYAVKTTTG